MTPRDGIGRMAARASEPVVPGGGSEVSPAWYDVSWNPTAGCSPVGPGCDHCEALRTVAQLARMGGKSGARYAGLTAAGRAGPYWTSELRVREELLTWPLRQRKGRRILVDSLSDLFHEQLATETIDTVHAVMTIAHWHRFLTLTRRAAQMRAYYSDPQTRHRIAAQIERLAATDPVQSGGSLRARRNGSGEGVDAGAGVGVGAGLGAGMGQEAGAGMPRNWPAGPDAMAAPGGSADAAPARAAPGPWPVAWPLPNLWLGVAIEDQEHADRIAHLLQTPAAWRWACFEPLLGPVRPDRLAVGADGYVDALAGAGFGLDGGDRRQTLAEAALRPLDWVVAGGETGAGARATDPDWVRDLRDRCTATGVPFFFKQWGEWTPAPGDGPEQKLVRRRRRAAGRLVDGRSWEEMPWALRETARRRR